MYAPPFSDLVSRIIGGGNVLKYNVLYPIVTEIHLCKDTQFPRYIKKSRPKSGKDNRLLQCYGLKTVYPKMEL